MIKCKVLSVQLVSFLGVLSMASGRNLQRLPRTPEVVVPDSQLAASLSQDSQLAQTGFAEAVQAGSQYFQYAHVPAKDHYEHGHKRGNEHHFIERHEKAHPHEGEFKTKVRWGDKHGGYGEHYWDYNHDGHGHHDGEESQNQEQYVPYEESTDRAKRALHPDVEFINEESKAKILSGRTARHGGNYRSLPELDRTRRQFIHF